MLQRLRSFINKVSKWPAPSSFRWDERVSLVAFLLFHAVTFARLLFPLQWVKFFHRRIYGKDRLFQKRTNFHSLFTEIYFVVAVVFLVLLDRLPGGPVLTPLKAILGAYLALEAVVWSAYYLFFRHFIERNFTIYHHAEYFLAFPLALLVQVLGVALAMGSETCAHGLLERAVQSLGYIFNSPLEVPSGDCTKFQLGWLSNGLALLGVFYVVVLLANLRDAFPRTQIKPITSLNVIGAGDVVSQRLLPAFVNPLPRPAPTTGAARSRRYEPVEIHPDAIQIFDVGDASQKPSPIELRFSARYGEARVRRLQVKRERSSQDVIVEVAATRMPTIVASPPDSHFFYVVMLAMHGIRFAVEKPITVFDPEVRRLATEGDALFADGFAMSYYALEKALPLTYLYAMHPMHRNHLDLQVTRDACETVDALPWNEVLGGLGRPQRIEVFLLEGASRSPTKDGASRQWTEDPHLGGLFYETAIHVVTVLHKITNDLTWFEPSLLALVSADASRTDACSFVHMNCAASQQPAHPETSLFVGKYMPEAACARGALIEYGDATVHCDFDRMALEIIPKGGTLPDSNIRAVGISVQRPYAQVRYAVQASLIRAFFEYGWQGPRFDDYDTQKAVLAWLSRYRMHFLAAQRAMQVYSSDGTGLPATLNAALSRYRKVKASAASAPL